MPKTLALAVFATEDVALPALDAVLEAGHRIARLVARTTLDDSEVTIPEEAQGERVEAWAREHGIEVDRPEDPGADEVRAGVAESGAELGLVVAYGAPFPTSLLDVFERGWIKLHFSSLPKLRGLHPIRAAVWDGSRYSGASVIEVTEDEDAGPIIGIEKIDLEPEETWGKLAPRLAELGAGVLVETLGKLAAGKKIKKRNQNEKSATQSPRFGRRHLTAPWWQDAGVVAARLRSLTPDPGMTTLINRERVRILAGDPMSWIKPPMGETGSFIGVRTGRLAVICGDDTVFGIERIGLPGEGRELPAAEYAHEIDLRVGAQFV